MELAQPGDPHADYLVGIFRFKSHSFLPKSGVIGKVIRLEVKDGETERALFVFELQCSGCHGRNLKN